nr:PH domain-containing protein [Nocardiopsis xinjiangensis]
MTTKESTTHYATFTRVMGVVWTVVALLLLIDVLLRGEGRMAWIASAFLAASVAGVYIMWLRPRVVSTERGLRMINPLREVFVPWSAVEWIDVLDVLRVHTPAGVVRSWPLRESKRSKVRENMRRDSGHIDTDVDDDPERARPVDLMARDLRRDAERHRARPLGGPIKDADEAGPAAIGAEDRPQAMVPVEVIVVLSLTAAMLVAVFLLA